MIIWLLYYTDIRNGDFVSLMKCKKCKKDVSSEAEKCVHCGSSEKEYYYSNVDKRLNYFWFLCILLGLFVILSIFVFIYISSFWVWAAFMDVLAFFATAITFLLICIVLITIISNQAFIIKELDNMHKKMLINWQNENKDKVICEECGLVYKRQEKNCPNCGNPLVKISKKKEVVVKKEDEDDDW